jgi:uncharacterized iron-regulated protein
MKKILITTMILMLGLALYSEAIIIRSSDMSRIKLSELTEDLMQYDLIFFGEHHGNQDLHALQKDILPGLIRDERNLILSFEMWERDTQDLLDAFLKAEITEESFTDESRAWPNYADYRPLILFAKEHDLTSIAANVPRIYASRTAREGWDFVRDLPPNERELIAQDLTAPDDQYKKEFMHAMNAMSAHTMDRESMDRFYMAQTIKDDTMAESIVRALRSSPDSRLIHFNGDFHSRSFLGTVSRVREALPKIKIAVLTPARDSGNISDLKPEVAQAIGTHIIVLPTPPAEEPK